MSLVTDREQPKLQDLVLEFSELTAECASGLFTRPTGHWRGEKEQCASSENDLAKLQLASEQLGNFKTIPYLNEVLGNYIDYSERIKRENLLLSGILEAEEQRSNAFYSGEFPSERDKRSDALEKSLHLSYLSGLQRKMIKNGISLLRENVLHSSPTAGSEILKALSGWFEIKQQQLTAVYTLRCEADLARKIKASEMVLGDRRSDYQFAGLERAYLREAVDQYLVGIEDGSLALRELELVTMLHLARHLPDPGFSPAKFLAKLQSDGIQFLSSELGELYPHSSIRLTKATMVVAAVGPVDLSNGRIKTIETSKISDSARMDLAFQLVDTISKSLEAGGRFPERANRAEVFFEQLSLPGTLLHCEMNPSGEIVTVSQCHFGDYPEWFSEFKAGNFGSMEDGLLRVVAIVPEYSGARHYDELDTRALLTAAGKVDFLFGSWEIGEGINLKGGRHVKAGHFPTGAVKRTDEGEIYQNLTMPVSYNLRRTFELLKPKGYLPPIHRQIVDEIHERSIDSSKPYETPQFARMYHNMQDPILEPFLYVPEEYIDEHYKERPEGIDPKHILYRFKEWIEE